MRLERTYHLRLLKGVIIPSFVLEFLRLYPQIPDHRRPESPGGDSQNSRPWVRLSRDVTGRGETRLFAEPVEFGLKQTRKHKSNRRQKQRGQYSPSVGFHTCTLANSLFLSTRQPIAMTMRVLIAMEIG